MSELSKREEIVTRLIAGWCANPDNIVTTDMNNPLRIADAIIDATKDDGPERLESHDDDSVLRRQEKTIKALRDENRELTERLAQVKDESAPLDDDVEDALTNMVADAKCFCRVHKSVVHEWELTIRAALANRVTVPNVSDS